MAATLRLVIEPGVDKGRAAAALAIVDGYQTALTNLHADDVAERRWYRERLRDARIAAGLTVGAA